MIVFNDGWAIRTVGEYLIIKRREKPGEIIIKAGAEGFEIDVYPEGDPEGPDSTLSVFYSDLEMLPDA